jgi:hypothetical protein
MPEPLALSVLPVILIRAIDSWTEAWQEGNAITDIQSKRLVDGAVGELARMYVRLGHPTR